MFVQSTSPLTSPESSDVLYYKIEGIDGTTFKRTEKIVKNCILKKWSAEIKNTDTLGKAIFLEFPFRIRKVTIENQLEACGCNNLVKISTTRNFLTDRDMKKLNAATRRLEREMKTNVVTNYQIKPVNEQISFQDLLDIITNTIVKKWFGNIALQFEEAKEVFISFPKKVEPNTISRYLNKEQLQGVLKVEHVHQIPSLESRKRFHKLRNKLSQQNDQ